MALRPSTTEQSAVAPQLPPKVTVTAVAPADPTRSLSPTFAQTETGDLTTSFDEMASTLPAGEVGIALFNGQQVTTVRIVDEWSGMVDHQGAAIDRCAHR